MAKAKGETSYSRNYSIGSRDMATAGQMVVEQRFHGGFQSKRDIGQRWAYFCKWAEPHGIKRMEKITKELVIEYGQSLQQELDIGERKSPSSPKNYVSAVNTVLRLATQGEWKTVKPGKDCGIQARSYIPTESKAMSMATHQTAQRAVDDRISSLLGLQRAFGLRLKKAVCSILNWRLKKHSKTDALPFAPAPKAENFAASPADPVE